MPIYYLNLEVTFKKPLNFISPNGKITNKKVKGFLLEVGATFPNISVLKETVLNEVFDKEEIPNLKIRYDHVGVIEKEDIQSEIYEDEDIKDSLLGDPLEQGIWYKSGRGYYQ